MEEQTSKLIQGIDKASKKLTELQLEVKAREAKRDAQNLKNAMLGVKLEEERVKIEHLASEKTTLTAEIAALCGFQQQSFIDISSLHV